MSKRTSITLDPEDERAVERFAQPGSPEGKALATWAELHDRQPGSVRSEAGVLRLLLRAGVAALAEDVLDAGYARLASDPEHEEMAETREARRRYVDRSEARAGE